MQHHTLTLDLLEDGLIETEVHSDALQATQTASNLLISG